MATPPRISISRDPFASKSLAFRSNSCIQLGSTGLKDSKPIFGPKLRSGRIEQTQLRKLTTLRSNQGLVLKASREPPGFIRQFENRKLDTMTEAENECDLFNDMKDRFLSFKKNKYMKNTQQFQNLARAQAPKFMVIACADSRVCPSNILGFQPGEAFMIRNVANLVPPFESGPSETNAALEFAVNTLKEKGKKSYNTNKEKVKDPPEQIQVENLMVIGHSCCGGIRALMSMEDDTNTSFIKSWVVVGKNARIKTEAAASSLSFDQKCKHCEKESVNHSISNLLTYPWIEEKVAKGELSIHGGYYDFIECTFEKWTLDYTETKMRGCSFVTVKDRMFWR